MFVDKHKRSCLWTFQWMCPASLCRFCLDSARQTRQRLSINWSNFSLKKATFAAHWGCASEWLSGHNQYLITATAHSHVSPSTPPSPPAVVLPRTAVLLCPDHTHAALLRSLSLCGSDTDPSGLIQPQSWNEMTNKHTHSKKESQKKCYFWLIFFSRVLVCF